MSRPPLKDVAARSGVSEPTVSRVLNGREGVSESTRQRVVDALAELGYHDVPEPQATLRKVIGIVCGEFLNPVFPTLLHHLSSRLARAGFLTSVAVTDPLLNREERCVGELTRSGVDGLILIGGHHARVNGDHSIYEQLAADGRPMVLVNGERTALDVPHVMCDEAAGAGKAVDMLLRLGHTRIGCVLGSAEFVPTHRFIDGYRRSLDRAGVAEPQHAIAETSFTFEGGRAGARRLLAHNITAMITGNDLIALGALRAAQDIRASGSVSVVGYDGTDFTAFTQPPLTTLRQPFEDMAQLVVDALLSEIDNSNAYRDQFVFEPALVVRESTHGAVHAAERAVG